MQLSGVCLSIMHTTDVDFYYPKVFKLTLKFRTIKFLNTKYLMQNL